MKFCDFAAVFVFAVAANVPLWIASRSLGLLQAGLFNLEFLLIGILSVFLRPALIAGLMLMVILLDLLGSVSTTYMLSASDLLRSSRSLFAFAPAHLWDLAVLTIGSFLVCLAAIHVSGRINGPSAGQRRRHIVLALTIFGVFIFVVDDYRGQIKSLTPDYQLGEVRLARLPTKTVIGLELQQAAVRRLSLAGADAPAIAASASRPRLIPEAQLSSPKTELPNVVLILVESWGKPVSSEIDESLVLPYSSGNLTERYNVTRGVVPFYGPTVDGEARELCGSTIGFGVLAAPADQLRSCLPAKYNALGYDTIGVHGFTERMFRRNEWYPRMGFGEIWFRDQLQRQGLPLCPGPFPGICDQAVSGWIGDRLESPSRAPQFIYWVTLNSHLPVPVPNHVDNPPSCSRTTNLAQSAALCSWYQLVFNLHRSVAELAMRPSTRPTIFVIAGDHAPPFSSSSLRSQFSDKVVPYVILTPKAGHQADPAESTQVIRSIADARRSERDSHKSPGKGV